MQFPEGCRVIAAALLVLTAGCATKKAKAATELDPFAVKPIVINANVKEARPAADDAERVMKAQTQLAQAQDAWRSGDSLTALAVVNHALLDGVPADLDGAFRDLRAKARSAVVATKICRARVVADKDAVADGDPIRVKIEFSNVSGTTLRVPKSVKGASDALVVLSLVREDYDVYGNARSNDFTLPVPVQEDLVLEPGKTQETRFTIPPEMAKLAHLGFSIVDLSGKFRPVSIKVGDTEFYDAIPIEPARVRVFMKGYEPLAADPLASLKKALEKRSPPHVLVATELLAPADRAVAKTLLVAAKSKDEELTPAIDAALARIAALDAGR